MELYESDSSDEEANRSTIGPNAREVSHIVSLPLGRHLTEKWQVYRLQAVWRDTARAKETAACEESGKAADDLAVALSSLDATVKALSDSLLEIMREGPALGIETAIAVNGDIFNWELELENFEANSRLGKSLAVMQAPKFIASLSTVLCLICVIPSPL